MARMVLLLVSTLVSVLATGPSAARDSLQQPAGPGDLDTRVSRFLEQHRYGWRDMNVPEADGRALHEIVLKNGYKSALEIGTSTGHSGIWIAWALAKTGGTLTTIEIDEGRLSRGGEELPGRRAGSFIDARLRRRARSGAAALRVRSISSSSTPTRTGTRTTRRRSSPSCVSAVASPRTTSTPRRGRLVG